MGLQKEHWMMIILALVFMVLSIYYPWVNYDRLPEMIPTHFDLAGKPDAWSEKSLGHLLVGPLITVITLLIMVVIAWWMAGVEDPRRVINGPKERIKKMSQERAEKIRSMAVFHTLLIMLLVSLVIMNVSIGQIQIASGYRENMGWGNMVIVALLIADAIYLTWQSVRLIYKSG
ncbi:MAG TPA: DUF1648 domain-containing protein [Clostridia bacterium]|nr:DUF1648 domain-containing protein [Clostridia bacterium]